MSRVGDSAAETLAGRNAHVRQTQELRGRPIRWAWILLPGLLLAACQPTVKVEAPKEPITINLNIKLDADVRVKLEEKAKEDIQANPNVF
jgi:hypothetical protein